MSNDKGAKRMVDFLAERGNYRWLDGNLPEPFQSPTVTLRKEDLVRFHNNYLCVLEFAAAVLSKQAKEVTSFDMMFHLMHMDSADGERALAEKLTLAEEREALARMIEHNTDRWWSSSEVAAAVRAGRKCHPECPMCEIEGRWGS